MKINLLLLICLISISIANAQNVNIPDANFKAALVGNSAINTNGDGEIQVSEASAYTWDINVTSLGIADLTGIEAFTALTTLTCSQNQLTSLNVSTNITLYGLYCDGNQLTSLNLPVSTALQDLQCAFNQLTSLDVSANPNLGTLYCNDNYLTSLVFPANTNIYFINCGNNLLTSLNLPSDIFLGVLLCSFNQLTSLNVSANPNLTTLYCSNNYLTSLDVSANTSLTGLVCRSNQITVLDVTANIGLGSLICDSNKITSLDVSAATYINELWCQSNQLTSLNVKNGYNTNFTDFHANNNPNLTCIQVDSVAYSNAYWSSGKDATASFSTNCGFTAVPTIDHFASVQITPNPANSSVAISGLNNIQKVELLNMQGQILKTIMVDGNASLIDVSGIANGIYQLKLSSSNLSKTERLVVAH